MGAGSPSFATRPCVHGGRVTLIQSPRTVRLSKPVLGVASSVHETELRMTGSTFDTWLRRPSESPADAALRDKLNRLLSDPN
jgi:hypothetical protein